VIQCREEITELDGATLGLLCHSAPKGGLRSIPPPMFAALEMRENTLRGDALRRAPPRTARMQNLQRSDTKALEVAK
jgi:hypothetical protein